MNGFPVVLGDGIVQTHWLEQASWAANIVLAVAAMLAIWQVFAAIRQARCALEQNKIAIDQLKVMASQLELAKTDIILRSKREAISVALEQCKRFAEQIVPHFDALTPKLTAKGCNHPQSINPEFPLLAKEEDPAGVNIWLNDFELRKNIVQTLNELALHLVRTGQRGHR